VKGDEVILSEAQYREGRKNETLWGKVYMSGKK
jgi:hypothetical protein